MGFMEKTMDRAGVFLGEIRLKQVVILFCFIGFNSCSEKQRCNNRFGFISESNDLPIVNLSLNKSHADILEQINNLQDIDLCELCKEVEVKIPLVIEGKRGYFKLIAEYTAPYCENCGMAIRKVSDFRILVNYKNQILAGERRVEKDSLTQEIRNYLNQVGTVGFFPDSMGKVNFSFGFNENATPELINSILKSLYTAHYDYVVSKVNKEGLDFCSLDEKAISKLKQKYPLRVGVFGWDFLVIEKKVDSIK